MCNRCLPLYMPKPHPTQIHSNHCISNLKFPFVQDKTLSHPGLFFLSHFTSISHQNILWIWPSLNISTPFEWTTRMCPQALLHYSADRSSIFWTPAQSRPHNLLHTYPHTDGISFHSESKWIPNSDFKALHDITSYFLSKPIPHSFSLTLFWSQRLP